MTNDPKVLQGLVKRKSDQLEELRLKIETTLEYLLMMKGSPELTREEKAVIEMTLNHLES